MAASRVLTRLIYASRWTDPDGPEPEEMIRQIIRTSIHNNRLDDVTGLLLFRRGWFLQVLEGRAGQVAATFSRILGDSRHTKVRLIEEARAETRLFRNWNMVASSAEALNLREFSELDPNSLGAGDALTLLTTVAEAERERERRAALGVHAA